MNNGIKVVLAFIGGAAIGSVVTWKLVEAKYAKIAQEEIDSVKSEFDRRLKEMSSDVAQEEPTPEEAEQESEAEEEELEDYDELVEELGYAEHSDDIPVVEKSWKKRYTGSPYVILPETFGEFEDYQTISLTYYSDHVLTDEDDEPIDDIDKFIGIESLNHFGEHEDDSVHVRNDKLKCDYEILLDQRKYSDVVKTKVI